jgi:hypothetical protein
MLTDAYGLVGDLACAVDELASVSRCFSYIDVPLNDKTLCVRKANGVMHGATYYKLSGSICRDLFVKDRMRETCAAFAYRNYVCRYVHGAVHGTESGAGQVTNYMNPHQHGCTHGVRAEGGRPVRFSWRARVVARARFFYW